MARIRKGLTFDDVLLEPKYSNVLPADISVRTQLTKNIFLNIPMVSAAMDTVTTAPLAIAIAREGGIGIIHKNMSIENQADQVRFVKRAEDGFIHDPITLPATATKQEALDLMDFRKIGGIPIVDENKKPIGIVTRLDLIYGKKPEDLAKKVTEFMTQKNKLITGQKGITLEEAERIMEQNKIKRLPIINEQGELVGLITYRDSSQVKEYPLASRDKDGQLLVGAAIGAVDDVIERVTALVEAGVDVVCLDSAHGHSENVLRTLRTVKEHFPKLEVIAGNVATVEGARDLISAGADAIKVGIGPGSICTTRIVAGCGVPQLTAIMDIANGTNGKIVPIIADGGIRYSGDMAKAIAAGASCIMAGSIFAGTEEAPGETILYEGRKFKTYRGMGSLSAMQEGSKDRYFQDKQLDNKKLVPEGIEGRVPYKGLVSEVIHQFIGGLKSGMGYCGSKDIDVFQESATFIEITSASMAESHPHDISITKEAPNYSR